MAKYNVHNLREGSRDGKWLEFWKNATHSYGKVLCHVVGCNEEATDGAHVQLDSPNNDKWYIVPMCHRHNCLFGAHLQVEGPLVPVNGARILQ